MEHGEMLAGAKLMDEANRTTDLRNNPAALLALCWYWASDGVGSKVNQGLSVYGNKGSTYQHAYIQQLRDGVPNFFATFIEVLRDRPPGAS